MDHAKNMDGAWVPPDELDRRHIVMLSTLGEGEFGFVTQALCVGLSWSNAHVNYQHFSGALVISFSVQSWLKHQDSRS